MKNSIEKSREQQQRVVEVILIGIISLVLLYLSRLEARLFSLSETLSANREFFTTLVYFALINLNVILILSLGFLIFRNVTKLVLERKRGVLGSKLRTKLVFALVFFALAPTILLFYVSTRFVMSSFETWFSEKVHITMEQTREAGSHVYKQDQKRLESLARIALQRIKFKRSGEYFENRLAIDPLGLAGFDTEYGINSAQVFDASGRRIWSSQHGLGLQIPYEYDHFVDQAVTEFLGDSGKNATSVVVGVGQHDVVKGVVPIRQNGSGRLLGVLLTEVKFETQILKSIEKILADFSNLKPSAQLIRASYMILMIVITLLIVFSATWLGFYVARGISGPLQSLAEATREIALGNYKIALNVKGDDETGQLVSAFNLMTKDLRRQQKETEEAQSRLQQSNEESDRRRQYMEILLEHITAGVLAVDARTCITSINAAAERLLKVHGSEILASTVETGLGDALYQKFWLPIQEGLVNRSQYSCQVDLRKLDQDVTLLVNATRVFDEKNIEIGFVVVFDDAGEHLKAGRVAAWREVAQRIAHEIKNPITPIKLNAQRMLRRFGDQFQGEDAEVFSTCLESIITQVDSLRDLVNEFSKFSRLPTNKPVSADIAEIVKEVIRLYDSSYPDIRFTFESNQLLPEIPLDKEQMNRVFVNLFTNSIAALEEGRPAVISVTLQYLQDVSTVRIEVADNGVGVPKALRERVLEPYFSTKDEGTGLGLAIVHKIITDHRGYLRLAENIPHGTKVIIELPVGSELS